MAAGGKERMLVLDSRTRRDDVDASIRAARHPGHDPARWALPLVAEADALADRRWQRVVLTATEAGALWLPPHKGEACHGDTMALAGGTGCTLHEAATWLTTHADAYAQANASCWSRIAAARDGVWGPIVVAPFAVGDRPGPPQPYEAYEARRGATRVLIVIDGLHRALGWALREEGGDDQPGRAGRRALEAFLAGSVSR